MHRLGTVKFVFSEKGIARQINVIQHVKRLNDQNVQKAKLYLTLDSHLFFRGRRGRDRMVVVFTTT
jgi:hypothetical protein